ncbi:hypothetical protein OROHE_005889 [Orobanche hederae]
MLSSMKDWLSNKFSMKDLGEAAHILGIHLYRDRAKRKIVLFQARYIEKILKRFRMENSERGFLLMRHGVTLFLEVCPQQEEDIKEMSKLPYASAVGSLMYSIFALDQTLPML